MMTSWDRFARICIVEDSLGVAQPLGRALGFHQNGGYQVETCVSGEAALKRLHETPFDLLISDLCLPGIDGLELIERAHQIRPGTRSILITAFGSPEVESRAKELTDAYLPKPFSLRDLVRLVSRILSEPVAIRPPAPRVVEIATTADQRRATHLMLLASDLDGTLTENGQVAPETWEMLRRAKLAGLPTVLVTGRMMDSFVGGGPYADLCEAIVAENGAVVCFPRRDTVRLPFGVLDPRVLQRLESLGVPLERGMAIASTWLPHDETVLRGLRDSGSGATLEYNRGAVMVLPPGASKGTGLLYALNELGYSPRNVIACGDAENDRSLFSVVELSAAVSNAHPTLKAAADTVLSLPNGAGVRALISDLLEGRMPPRKSRPTRRLLLGHRMSGAPLQMDPFAVLESNVGIVGASQTGKSWLAGLLAEELLAQGYQVCIVDPEGDYRGLGASPHTLVLGRSGRPLPAAIDVANFGEWHNASLVLDLSLHSNTDQRAYLRELLQAVRSLRTRRGRPHCVLIDEIQNLCPCDDGEMIDLLLDSMQWGGFCLVGYRPSQVNPLLLEAISHWLVTRLNLPEEIEILRPHLVHFPGSEAMLEQFPTLSTGQACLALGASGQPVALGHYADDHPPQPGRSPEIIKFRVGPRAVPHMRHLHKYLRAPLPMPKRFYFYHGDGQYLGRVAANLWEFREVVGNLPVSSLHYHLERGDFERWLSDVLHDDELARRVHKVAGRNHRGEGMRQALLEVVAERYEELATLA
jgi:hydroxymethylpyrimidine pyrophosphatase-like HAD family hydrolase/DNA-binding NarL/FixJ family response regulator